MPESEANLKKEQSLEGLIKKSFNSITPLDSGNYVFANIPCDSNIVPAVELCTARLDNGMYHNPLEWRSFTQNNADRWSVLTLEMLYQLLFRAYNLRDDAKYGYTIKELTIRFQDWFYPGGDSFALSNFVHYSSGFSSLLSSFDGFKVKSRLMHVPDAKHYQHCLYLFKKYAGSYITLAESQPEHNLGNACSLSESIEELLKVLLGNGSEHAGAVFQYFSSREDNDNLREVRLLLPEKRGSNLVRGITVGCLKTGRFNINLADDFDCWPALGARAVSHL